MKMKFVIITFTLWMSCEVIYGLPADREPANG